MINACPEQKGSLEACHRWRLYNHSEARQEDGTEKVLASASRRDTIALLRTACLQGRERDGPQKKEAADTERQK